MDKSIVVLTGAAGNIGKAITRKYLKEDCIVIGLDIRSNVSDHEICNNNRYEYHQMDVTDVESIYRIKDIINKKYGNVTHLISGAGNPMPSEFNGLSNLTIEDIDNSIKLNLNSHIYLTKVFLDLLKNDNSENKTITLISSINAIKNFDIPAYSAAKSGIYGFMNATVRELGNTNIRINTISPGTIIIPGHKENVDGALESKRKLLALKEFTVAEDISDAMFSITHLMKALTGQNITIDKGQVS